MLLTAVATPADWRSSSLLLFLSLLFLLLLLDNDLKNWPLSFVVAVGIIDICATES